MPFKSQAQRAWMYANDPEMAKRWEAHTPKGKKLSRKVKKRPTVNRSQVSRLKADPSQTYMLRKRFEKEVITRFNKFKAKLVALIQKEDAFGLTVNYNPNQPRDNRGRWTSGGGTSDVVIDAVNKAVDELEIHQSSSSNEMRIVIDGDSGDVLAKVEGEADRVDIAEHIGKMLEKNVIDLHSHPDKSSMSDGDWGAFAWLHVKEMYVVSEGEIFSLRKTDAWNNLHHSKRSPRVVKERWNSIVDEITSGDNWTVESAIFDTNVRMAKEFGIEFTSYPRDSKITTNTRWKFRSDPKKVEEFRLWVQKQMDEGLLESTDSSDPNKWWDTYLEEAYKKGQLNSFEGINKQKLGESLDFYKGTKEQFLRDSFAKPETKEKVQLLASRVFTDLKGVTEAMASAMSRTLVDGLSQGQGPHTIAKQMTLDIDSIGINRARMIARTETIRAHAEGQLDALETMGIEEVGVAVEWNDTGDGRVCPLCTAMDGVVLKVKEAHGLIPRHPNCRCAFLPANVGESKKGQIRGPKGIQEAFKKSIVREIPKGSKRTFAEQKKRTSWQGADKKIAKKRPKSILD